MLEQQTTPITPENAKEAALYLSAVMRTEGLPKSLTEAIANELNELQNDIRHDFTSAEYIERVLLGKAEGEIKRELDERSEITVAEALHVIMNDDNVPFLISEYVQDFYIAEMFNAIDPLALEIIEKAVKAYGNYTPENYQEEAREYERLWRNGKKLMMEAETETETQSGNPLVEHLHAILNDESTPLELHDAIHEGLSSLYIEADCNSREYLETVLGKPKDAEQKPVACGIIEPPNTKPLSCVQMPAEGGQL